MLGRCRFRRRGWAPGSHARALECLVHEVRSAPYVVGELDGGRVDLSDAPIRIVGAGLHLDTGIRTLGRMRCSRLAPAQRARARGLPCGQWRDNCTHYFGICTSSRNCSSVSGRDKNLNLRASATRSARPTTRSGTTISFGSNSSRMCLASSMLMFANSA